MKTTKKAAAKTTRPKTVDAYLAAAPKETRAALTKLRTTIKARLRQIGGAQV